MKNIKVADDIHKRFKVYCAEKSMNMVNLVGYLMSKEMGIEQPVKKSNHSSKNKKP